NQPLQEARGLRPGFLFDPVAGRFQFANEGGIGPKSRDQRSNLGSLSGSRLEQGQESSTGQTHQSERCSFGHRQPAPWEWGERTPPQWPLVINPASRLESRRE